MRALTLILAMLAVASCEGNGLVGPDFESQLVLKGGCGDVLFYAVDEDDELLLTFVAVQGLVANARDAGEEVRVTLAVRNSFGLGDGNVTLEQGTRVSDVTCDDVAEPGGAQIRRSWTGIEGTATITIRPVAGQEHAMADLLLENVLLRPDEDGWPLRVERMEWTNVQVGWYPG